MIVVHIDDDECILELVKDRLTYHGCEQVHSFKDHNKAIRYLNMAPDPDLIIVDGRLKGALGHDVAETIREKGYDGFLVMMSGDVDILARPTEAIDFFVWKGDGVDAIKQILVEREKHVK